MTLSASRFLKLASRSKRIYINTGEIQAKPVKSYVDVTNDNYYLLEILDVLKDFLKIPDLNKKTAIKYLLDKLRKISVKEKTRIIKYAIQYPPRVRAFLGALLSKSSDNQDTVALKQSLNPLTTYDLGIKKEWLSTASNWNIK